MSDKLRDSVNAFLTHTKILIDKKEGTKQSIPVLFKGGFFFTDDEYRRLARECLDLIYARKKFFQKNLIHEEEIIQLLNRKAIAQHSDQINKTNEFLADLETIKNVDFSYTTPNHAIFLHDDVPIFVIGPVSCSRTADLHYNNIGGEEVITHPQCFTIKARCSSKSVYDYALWQVDVALSLLRIHLITGEAIHGFFPYTGELDPLPMSERKEVPHILIEDGALTSRFTNFPHYEISQNVIAKLDPNFDMNSAIIFSPKPDTMAERLQKALGWMTRARRSDDNASRFLMFFTALESLLSHGKDAISDTIARHVATLVCIPEYRSQCYKKVKTLYNTRSELVHEGSRNVSISECKQLQEYIEMTCWIVMKYSSQTSLGEFFSALKEAAWGKEWPLLMEQPKTTIEPI